MTTLQTLVSSFSDLSNANAIHEHITSKNIKRVVGNKDVDIRGIEFVYGRDFTIGLLADMENILAAVTASGDTASAKYLKIQFDRLIGGTGQNFSDAMVRKQLDDLVSAGLLPAISAQKLKAIGVKLESQWEQVSTQQEPSLEDVELAITEILKRREAGAYWSRVLALVNPMIDAGNTATEIKAAAEGVE